MMECGPLRGITLRISNRELGTKLKKTVTEA